MFALALRRVKWEKLYRLSSCEEQFSTFQSTVHSLIESNFPTRTKETHSKDKPSVTEHFKLTVKEQQKAWQRGDLEAYRKWRNTANRLCSSLRKSFFRRHMAHLEPRNFSGWWRTVQSLMDGRKDSTTALEPLTKPIGVGNMETLANKINALFHSVAAHLPPLTEDSPFLAAECNVPNN